LGTFLRGILLSIEKPVRIQKDKITHRKENVMKAQTAIKQGE
jgi:hypothetical protein